MDLSAILLFGAVLAGATAMPGPTIATLVARTLTLGPARNNRGSAIVMTGTAAIVATRS